MLHKKLNGFNHEIEKIKAEKNQEIEDVSKKYQDTIKVDNFYLRFSENL